MKLPKVSIVIPVFDREDLIEDAINSALNQTYENYEIIVVDNQSTDRTWQIVQRFAEQYSQVIAFQNEENIGPVKNWLKGIKLAKGEYVKILFSDDLLFSDCVSAMVAQMDEDVAFVGCSVAMGRHPGAARARYHFSRVNRTTILPAQKFINDTLLAFGGLVSPGAAMFRRSDLISTFTEDIDYEIGESFSYYGAGPDLLMFLRVGLKYEKVFWFNKPLVFFREHLGSATMIASTTKLFDIKASYLIARIWFAENYGYEKQASIIKARSWRVLKNKFKGMDAPTSLEFLISAISFLYRFPVSVWLNR